MKNLRRKLIILAIAAALIIIVIISGFLIYGLYHHSTNPSAMELPQVRDAAMAYIKTHHEGTSQYMQNLSWSGKDITPPGYTGGEWYSYESGGWNLTINYAVGLPPTTPPLPTGYSVTANYTAQTATGQVEVFWQGNVQAGAVTEIAYTFNS